MWNITAQISSFMIWIMSFFLSFAYCILFPMFFLLVCSIDASCFFFFYFPFSFHEAVSLLYSYLPDTIRPATFDSDNTRLISVVNQMEKIMTAYRKASKQWCSTQNKLAQGRA
jgi:hypothetical protein